MSTEPSTGKWFLLPAPPGTCPECARDHPENQPHDAQTLFYQTKFNLEHGRAATWGDAMAHCSPEVRLMWTEQLNKLGVTW